MMFSKITSKLIRKQQAFTLVEVIVAISILSVIMLALAGVTMQIFNTNDLSTNRTLAIRQVQNTGQWISRDVLQTTEIIDLNSPNGFDFVIHQNLDGFLGINTVVTYSVVEIDGLYKLLRTEKIGDNPVSEPITIATNLVWDTSKTPSEGPSWFRFIGLKQGYELKVTVTIGTGNNAATETRIYQIKPRVDSV
ncbi:MAG: PulJ/GspJ family protein [Dehalogenimonas sp.]